VSVAGHAAGGGGPHIDQLLARATRWGLSANPDGQPVSLRHEALTRLSGAERGRMGAAIAAKIRDGGYGFVFPHYPMAPTYLERWAPGQRPRPAARAYQRRPTDGAGAVGLGHGRSREGGRAGDAIRARRPVRHHGLVQEPLGRGRRARPARHPDRVRNSTSAFTLGCRHWGSGAASRYSGPPSLSCSSVTRPSAM
jgi:hypothetical protein